MLTPNVSGCLSLSWSVPLSPDEALTSANPAIRATVVHQSKAAGRTLPMSCVSGYLSSTVAVLYSGTAPDQQVWLVAQGCSSVASGWA